MWGVNETVLGETSTDNTLYASFREESEEVNFTVDDNHIDDFSQGNELLQDVEKDISTARSSTLEDGIHQKDIIEKYMGDKDGEVISCDQSEHSDSGDASKQAESESEDAEEEVTNIQSIILTADVTNAEENDRKFT